MNKEEIIEILQHFDTNVLFYILYLVKRNYEEEKIRVVDAESKGLLLPDAHKDLKLIKNLATGIEGLIVYIASTRYSRGKDND